MELYKIIKDNQKYMYESKKTFEKNWKEHKRTVAMWRAGGLSIDFKGYKLVCDGNQLNWREIRRG